MFAPVYFVNGQAEAPISGFDRGLAYGDGIFETCRVLGDQIPLLALHLDRLSRGASVLGLSVDREQLIVYIQQALAASASFNAGSRILKIIITRGVGGRGYKTAPDASVNYIISCQAASALDEHPAWQQGLRVRICDHRLGRQGQLAGIKHLNRLDQVVARREWGDAFDDGLMLDYTDHIVESISGNLLFLKNGQWLSPHLDECGVAGVLRAHLAQSPHWQWQAAHLSLNDLPDCDEICITNAVVGALPLREIYHHDTCIWRAKAWPQVQRLQQYLQTDVFHG